MQITANRKRVPIVVIVGLTLIILLTFAIVNIVRSEDEGLKQLIFICVGFLISAVYFTSISLLDYWKTLFNSYAVLSIGQDGINDNLSLFSCGKFTWDEISNVRIQQAFKTDFLIIDIYNADFLIANQSKWKQRTLRGFQRKFGSPVVVSQKRIKQKVEDVKAIIAGHLQ